MDSCYANPRKSFQRIFTDWKNTYFISLKKMLCTYWLILHSLFILLLFQKVLQDRSYLVIKKQAETENYNANQ